MSALQLMIDELEARANTLQEEITQEEQELLAMSAKAKELATALDTKREKQNNFRFAAGRIRDALDAEPLQPMKSNEDPWGAG